MNKNVTMGLGAVLLAGVAALAGNWWGARHAATTAAAVDGSVAAGSQAPQAGKTRKLLYYRNPMGLADTSPTPKKDAMGMDYTPVYEGEDEDSGTGAKGTPGTIQISAEKIQKLGVRTEAATLRVLDSAVRASGRIEADERRISTIAPKFEGYVDKLLVNATGQTVAKGQALLEAYSPDLVAAQREYAIAAQGVQSLDKAGGQAQGSMQQLADASLARLRNWDVSDEQLKALAATGAAQRTVTLRSPVSGIVTEKKAVQGMRFMPGDALFQVTDLSSVWVLADVAEQDIANVRLGARAQVQVNAYPDQRLSGAIRYIYPTLNAETRTVPVRLDLPNPGGRLLPGMFAQVEVAVGAGAKVLTVPVSAVIDSGKRQMVLVQKAQGSGRFEPREVKLGARSDNYLEVLQGLQEGEQVVTSANFLIDAESNLLAAVAGFGSKAPPAPAPATPAKAAAVGHQAQGQVQDIDAKAQTLTISHGPVLSLQWKAMTMEFALANSALLEGVKPGARVAFEFVERAKGEWVITALRPQTMPQAK